LKSSEIQIIETSCESNSLEALSKAGLTPTGEGAGGNSLFGSDLKSSEIQNIERSCESNSVEASSEAGLAPTIQG
jgi:hypothetical protein